MSQLLFSNHDFTVLSIRYNRIELISYKVVRSLNVRRQKKTNPDRTCKHQNYQIVSIVVNSFKKFSVPIKKNLFQ